jgi:hypothetical protein
VQGELMRYFDWVGAAMYTADRRSGSMHGKQFLLDSVYAGIDEHNVYGRLDFVDAVVPETPFALVVNMESVAGGDTRPLRLEVSVSDSSIHSWRLQETESERVLADRNHNPNELLELALGKVFIFKLPLSWARLKSATGKGLAPSLRDQKRAATGEHDCHLLRLRFSLWQEQLPIDALPLEGWIVLHLVEESELAALVYSN